MPVVFFPGAFTSTKAIQPPGKRTILSGIPSNPGETNFGQIPPCFFTISVNFCSIAFSLIMLSPFVFLTMCKVYQCHLLNSFLWFFLEIFP